MKKYIILLLSAFVYFSLQGIKPETRVLRYEGNGIGVLSQYGTNFGFFMPETGGYLLTGVICGEKSMWLYQAKKCDVEKQKNGWIVNISDPMLGKGKLKMHVLPLTSSNGLILEVTGEKLPENLQFFWAYGGCSARTDSFEKTTFLQPEQCLNNVFSREINSFTAYYGPNVRLKVMMGVAPLDTETKLSDAHKISSPFELWNSDKRTDAPVMSALNTVKSGTPYYYCIYRQNKDADYNYYMLPDLFNKELNKNNSKQNEKARPNGGFGPDFNF
jgi:hypothetical protein